MQGDVGDGDAADENGFEPADGREVAALADLPLDVLQHRRLLLGFILVGDEPARGFAGRPEAIALLERIDLHDHAVGHVRELGADFFEVVDARDRFIDVGGLPDFFGKRDAPLAEKLRPFPVAVHRHGLDLAEAVGEEAQAALGDDLGVEPAERAGGEVARVGVRLLALGLDLLVDALEVGVVHVDFAADLEDVGDFGGPAVRSAAAKWGQRERDGFDGARVDGNVVTYVTAPARCGEN